MWTHEAHIAVAFSHLFLYKNTAETSAALREKIKAYNVAVGTENTDTSGYHETLTVFWVRVIQAYMAYKKPTTIEEAFSGFLKTLAATSKFPERFFTRELLFSKFARHNWVDPDILPISKIGEIISQDLERH